VRKEHLDIPVAEERNDVPPPPVPREAVADEINIWRQSTSSSNEGKSFYLREMREMRVTIEIAGLPLYKTFGKSKKIEFEFPGKTLKELIDAMVRKFGFEIKRFLLDKNGDIDMDIRILLNGATYLSENRMQISLNEGDTLVFKAPS
jgi:hypothetical protein